MGVDIIWHGHSNVQISSGGVTVLVDPFFTHNPVCRSEWKDARPDLVLVTHDHGDHTGDAVAICTASGALCGCVVGTAEKLQAQGLDPARIVGGIGFNIGGSFEHKGVRVTMVQAFHSSESGVPAGYVIRMPDGFTVYHAGDTGIFGDMEIIGRLYPLDLACLPCGGFFTMDALQAAEAARLLKPKTLLPIHWGTFGLLAQTTTDLAAEMKRRAPDCRLLDAHPGDSFTL